MKQVKAKLKRKNCAFKYRPKHLFYLLLVVVFRKESVLAILFEEEAMRFPLVSMDDTTLDCSSSQRFASFVNAKQCFACNKLRINTTTSIGTALLLQTIRLFLWYYNELNHSN